MRSLSHEFSRIFDDIGGEINVSVIAGWVGLKLAQEASGPGKGGQTRRFRRRFCWLSPPRMRCANSCGLTCLCCGHRPHVCFMWTKTFSVLGDEEAFGGGGGGNTLEMPGSNLELGRCSLSYNLHVVTTISGALRCRSPCKPLMYPICLQLVVPHHVGSGSPQWRAKPLNVRIFKCQQP